MKQFLLLRSNKQSGPYSADELREMGLKAYDLIWVEGKSAAWRYPGEVDELKSFAPAVEEQPYDRFYKKPVEQEQKEQEAPTDTPSVSITPAKKTQPAEKPVVRKPKEYKRVFVTLPSGAQVQAKETAEPVKPQVQQVVPQPAPPPVGSHEFEESKPTYLSQQAQKPADIYYPEKRPARRRILPVAVIVMGMVFMVALGIVIGMYIDSKPGLSLQKSSSPVEDNSKQEVATDQPQDVNGNGNSIDNTSEIIQQQVPQVVPIIDSSKQDKTVTPVTKKKKVAPAVDSTGNIAFEPVKTEEKIDSEDATAKRPLNKPVPELEKMVSVTNNDYQVGPFGGISKLALTLTNSSEYDLSLVVVQLQYLKVNKEVFKTENLYFRDVAANSSITVNAPRSNRGNTINYKVTLINSKDHIYHAGN